MPRVADDVAAAARVPQHLQALRAATEIRLARAELRHRVADGRASVAAVLLANPREARTMTVYDLLDCQRQWGPCRCAAFVARVGLSQSKRVGELTPRQREMVAYHLSRV